MARILLPTPLRPYAGGQTAVEVVAATVGEALDRLHRPALSRGTQARLLGRALISRLFAPWQTSTDASTTARA